MLFGRSLHQLNTYCYDINNKTNDYYRRKMSSETRLPHIGGGGGR